MRAILSLCMDGFETATAAYRSDSLS